MSTSSPVAALEELRARLVDRYRIERELGRGGMGAVYLARDVKLDRHVALKVLPAEFAVQPVLRDRFLRETRTAAGFSHPNIVPVYSVEESDDLLAYAMGYVEGESLVERVRRAGPLTVRETVKLMQDVAYALGYAHGRGIVHRDIKPDNIMIDRASGRALVMDFGIARAKSNAPAAGAGLTRVGEVVGTPEYMSPEQASGDEVDGRSDLYSLGLSIIYAVTGKVAITGESTQKVLVKQLTETLPPVSSLRTDLPEALAQAIDRCVMKNPSERFETAEGLVESLDNAQLVAAEVPLPIRLFQHEASTLTFISIAFFIASAYIVRFVARRRDGDEELLIIVVLFAVVVTRALQTMREARRLALVGFMPEEITEGLRRVVDEFASRRQELRADPEAVQARRRAVLAGALLLPTSAVCSFFAIRMRVLVEPGRYNLPPAAALLIIVALFALGAGFVLLLKSPIRMPAGERIFRRVWLGPLGRAFVRFASRGVEHRRGGRTLPSASRVSAVGTKVVAASASANGNGNVNANQRVNVIAANDASAQALSVSSSDGVEQRLRAIEDRLSRLEGR